jgi:glutamyl-tRNA reductase
MGKLAARALEVSAPGEVVIVNRTQTRAGELAAALGARFRPFDELEAVLADADIVITSTTATGIVIDTGMVARAVEERPHRPLFIVDIAVPRDVEPEVASLPGVVLRDIDDLRDVVEAGVSGRAGEVAKVEGIIDEEVAGFAEWLRAGEAAPTASALVARADEIRRAELKRMAARLNELSPEDRDAVDHLTRRIVAKILHTPLAKSRSLAGTEGGDAYLRALRALFDLDEE